MNPPGRSTWRTPWRIALIAVAAVIVLLVGATGIFLGTFDPNSLKPRIIEAVKRATGRDLALNGKISLKLSLQPTIEARDVAFANPPGFSRPQMATLDRLQLQLGLLPLLASRVEIERLVLMQPDILLETDAAGQPNWQLTPQVPPSASTIAQSQPEAEPHAATEKKVAVGVNAISIRNGTLAYRDDRANTLTTLGLPKLEAIAASPDAPLHVEADATYNGTAFNLAADTGGLTRLQNAAANTPWPVTLALTVTGAKLAADGSFIQPLRGRGYDLSVNGNVPDLSALAPLLPSMTLPSLHEVNFAARIADRGGEWPAVSALTLHAGASDLNAQVPGLRLAKLDIAGSALDQPIKADIVARLGGALLAMTATLGPPALLMPDAKPQPFPVDVTLQAAGATAAAKGNVADIRAMAGAEIALTAQIPDLSALSPLAQTPLPALKSITFQASLTDVAGGLRNGATLHRIALNSPDADLAGDATFALKPRTSLTATLASNHINLDAMQAAVDQAAAPQPGTQPAAAPAQPAAKPSQRGQSGRIFSDQPIPFDLLRGADAELRLRIATLRSGEADYKAIATHVVLTSGRLAVDPLTADLPQGQLNAKVSVDASQPAPPVRVSLHASGLALKSILTVLHQPSYASGNVEVYADLNGAGATPHAIAASLDGSLGLAMAGGTIDNRLLGSILGRVMEQLNALNLVGRGGTSDLRCFAVRLEAQHGVAAIRALALSSALLTLTGSGTLNLGDETMAMILRPEGRIAGASVVVPIQLTGPIRAPATAVNKLGAAEANAGSVAGAVTGTATPLGILGGLFGADKLLTGGGGDICAPALAAARGGKVAQETQPTPSRPAAPGPSDPAAALRNLFR